MGEGESVTIDLRCGDWRDVLGDVDQVDCLLTDPPYSERTHGAYSPHTDVLTACERDAKWAARGGVRRQITYDTWSTEDVAGFVRFWAVRTRGWFVAMTDHVLAPTFERELEGAGRYVFSPLSFVDPGSRVRLAGDGPAQWSVSIVVSRPRLLPFSKWGALPGAYVLPPGNSERMLLVGGKPLWLMRALVRDYSRPGDVICDPCAGGATTLLAAAIEGRRAIGAELDPDTFAKAQARIARGYTPATLFAERKAPEQQTLEATRAKLEDK